MLWNTGQMNGTVLLDGNYTNMAYDSVIRYAQNPRSLTSPQAALSRLTQGVQMLVK